MLDTVTATRDAAARPRGRRRGGADTRTALVDAARAEFAEHGFTGATLRAIAARAGTDPAMVSHWFGDKQGLFQAVMDLPLDPRHIIASVLDGPRDRVGERLVRTYLGVWDAHPEQMTALVRSVTSHERAAATVREFMQRAILGPLVVALHVDHPELRVELCATQMIGLAIGRFVVRLDAVARADPSALVAIVGPTLQRYLTGRLVATSS